MDKKKNLKKTAAYNPGIQSYKIYEPKVNFQAMKPRAVVKDFNYNEFKRIADKVPFSLYEWSQILHISERTLQRYAKANSTFPFSVVDRILQIEKVIKKGVEVFGNLEKFISWLRSDPYMLEGRLSLHALGSIEGINLVLTQLGRIEHGLFA